MLIMLIQPWFSNLSGNVNITLCFFWIREIDEATFGVPEVEDAFYAYHECIDQAKADISSRGDGKLVFLLNLPLSSTTSRELLSQFSPCSG